MLFGGLGQDQARGGAWPRADESRQEFAHLARMVLDAEFLLEDADQDGRGPSAGVQALSHRAAVHEIMELLPLGFVEFARATTAVPFLDALHALRIPVANPGVNAAAVDLQ